MIYGCCIAIEQRPGIRNASHNAETIHTTNDTRRESDIPCFVTIPRYRHASVTLSREITNNLENDKTPSKTVLNKHKQI